MQIILREKIRKLGKLGDTVNVKPGFARNYLVPTGRAMIATKENLAHFEAERAALEHKAQTLLEEAQARAQKLQGLTIKIKASVGEGGKLFGSIGTRDIVDAIKALGMDVERHEVRLPHGAIRLVGIYDVEIHVHSDVSALVKIEVVPDEGLMPSVASETAGENSQS